MKVLDVLNEADITSSQPSRTADWIQRMDRALARLYSTDPTHRYAARDAIKRLQVIFKNKYEHGPRFETPDEDTIERLAKATEMLNKIINFLAAEGKQGPTESCVTTDDYLLEGRRKRRRKKTRLQKMYGRTRRGFGAFYGGYYGGGWGGSFGDSSSDGGGDGGGGDGGGGGE